MNTPPDLVPDDHAPLASSRKRALHLLRHARDICAQPQRDADPQSVIDMARAMLDSREPLLGELAILFGIEPELTQEPQCRQLLRELYDLGTRWVGAMEQARGVLQQRRIAMGRAQRGRRDPLR